MDGSIDYKALFESAPVAYLILSPEENPLILGANHLFWQLIQKGPDQIVGRRLFEVFHDNPEDPESDGQQNLRKSLATVLLTGQPNAMPLQRYSVREPLPEDAFQARYWSVLTSPVLDPVGKATCLIQRVEEVTDLVRSTAASEDEPERVAALKLNTTHLPAQLLRRFRDLENLNRNLSEANRAIQLSEQRFLQLAENSTFGLMICNLQGRVSYLNPALRKIIGYTAEDVARGLVRWDTITPPEFAERDARAVNEILQLGSCAPFEKAYIAKDGRLVPIMVGASVLAARDEQVEVAAFILDLTDKLQSQELLRASDLRNRTLLESLPQLVWTCARDGNCTYLSSQWVAYTGIPEQEQLGLKWLDLVMHPGDRDRTFEAWMRAVSGEAAYDLEYRLRRHDGVYRWFKTRGIPVPDENGQAMEWFGTCTDIDDQIRSEQEARLAVEERGRLWREYDTALSNNPDLNYSFDLDGRFTYGNRALLSLLQKSLPELVGHTFTELEYPPELAKQMERQIEHVIATRKPIRDETPFTDPSGTTRHYEYIFTPVFGGDSVEAVTGSTRDITERKSEEEKLRASEQLLRFALQAGRMNSWEYGPALFEQHAGAWVNGLAGLVEVWNSQTLHRILRPEDRQRVEQLFERSLRDGTEVETEIRIRQDGQDDRWVWVRGAPTSSTESQPRIAGLISDVTERRILEERFRESARLESIGVLAGGIAHDFNNLLTGILGNSSLAMDEIGSHHPVAPLLEGVVLASERAATLTNQILAYSGRGKFVVKNIELAPFIREVSTMIKASIPRHVHLDLHLLEPLSCVQADVTQMQQVIMNLIVNAAESIPVGKAGQVDVTTGESDLTRAQLAGLRNAFEAEPGRFVSLAVQDNGPGMDEATQQKMFDPFFTTKFTGRGLGLSAVLGILRGHKGAIGIDSQLGRGTRIVVYLPAATPAELPLAIKPDATLKRTGQGIVLVIDDEETVRTVAGAMLRHSGFEVILANDGEQGIRLFRERHREIRAILLDLSMPVMDGETALPLLREIDPNVPIILSTGYSEVEANVRFARDGLAAVLQKPYKAAQMKEVLRLALNGN